MAQFGSLVNYLSSGTNGQPEPEVGMGVTFLYWSDRAPGTIVAVERFKSGERKGQVRRIGVQRDKATRVDGNGMSESQDWTFEPDPDAPVKWANVRKDGAFYADGTRLRVGSRDKYFDFSF